MTCLWSSTWRRGRPTATIPLGGQPDSVAISVDGRYAAIAIENERDEDVNEGEMPQDPAGFLTIVDLIGPPLAWATRDVVLTAWPNGSPLIPSPSTSHQCQQLSLQ